MSIYFFHGDEDYNIELEINKLKSKLLDKSFSTMNFKVAKNPNIAELISLLRTQPMMFGNLMVVVHCEKYFSASKASKEADGGADDNENKGFSDKELNEISNALEDNIDSLCIVFVANVPRNQGKKIDTRKKIYKTITKYAQTQEFPTFPTYKVKDISNWINKESKKHDITLENDALLMLIEQLGNDLRGFALELEKLKLLAYPEKKVTKKMVKEICVSNEDLFGFADFLIKGEKGRALMEFQKLLDKKHPLEVLSALHTMLRKWITIKSKSKELSFSAISKLVGQHEFVVEKTLEKMKNTSLKDLVTLKQNLIEAEYRVKSGMAFNVVDEVERAFLKV